MVVLLLSYTVFIPYEYRICCTPYYLHICDVFVSENYILYAALIIMISELYNTHYSYIDGGLMPYCMPIKSIMAHDGTLQYFNKECDSSNAPSTLPLPLCVFILRDLRMFLIIINVWFT